MRTAAAGAELSELSTEIAVNSLRFRKILRFRAKADDFGGQNEKSPVYYLVLSLDHRTKSSGAWRILAHFHLTEQSKE